MKLQSNTKKINSKIKLGGSKSISNRLLILNALFDNKIALKNISDAEDTDLLTKALTQTDENIVDIHKDNPTNLYIP